MKTTFSLFIGLLFIFQIANAQIAEHKIFEFQGRYEVFVNGNTLLQSKGKTRRRAKTLLYQTDVDIDPYTYGSNAINVTVPDSTKIVGAYIVWAANYSYCFVSERKKDSTLTTLEPSIEKKNTVKFKAPFDKEYKTYKYKTVVNNDFKGDKVFKPSVHYSDITKVFSKQKRISGRYWLADFNTIQGNSPRGLSSGWSIILVYESPKTADKFISGVIGCNEVDKGIKGNLKHENVVNTFESQSSLPYSLTLFSLTGNSKKGKTQLFWKHDNLDQVISLTNNDQKNLFQGKIQAAAGRTPYFETNFGVDLMTINDQFSSQFFPYKGRGVELNVETKNNANIIYSILEVPVNIKYQEIEEEQEFIQEEIVKEVDTVKVQAVTVAAVKRQQQPMVNSKTKTNRKRVSTVKTKKGNTKRTPKVATYHMKGMTPGYYIVNGVFRVATNRDSWINTINYSGFTINYFVLPRNKWNYIYCYHNASFQETFKKLKEVRSTNFFNNSWIIKIEN